MKPTLLGLALLSGVALAQSADPTLDLARRALGDGQFGTRVQLLPGAVPDGSAGQAFKPEGAKLVGSVVRNGPGREDVQVYYDSPHPAESVIAALKTQLEAAGWKAFRTGPTPQNGFLSSEAFSYLNYYKEAEQQAATLTVAQIGAVSQISVSVNRDSDLKQRLAFDQGVLGQPDASFPALRAPAGATVQPQGSGGSSLGRSTSASIQSDLKPAALFDHYARQLDAVGWKSVGRTGQDPVQTGVWSFTQDARPATGLLIVRQDSPGQYTAQLEIIGTR